METKYCNDEWTIFDLNQVFRISEFFRYSWIKFPWFCKTNAFFSLENRKQRSNNLRKGVRPFPFLYALDWRSSSMEEYDVWIEWQTLNLNWFVLKHMYKINLCVISLNESDKSLQRWYRNTFTRIDEIFSHPYTHAHIKWERHIHCSWIVVTNCMPMIALVLRGSLRSAMLSHMWWTRSMYLTVA